MYERGNQFEPILNAEFGRIEDAINLPQEALRLDPRGAAPTRPRSGTLLYADGTNYNPGSGAGLYVYTGSAWVFLSGSANVYTPTLTNVTNLAASTAYQCQWSRVGNIVTVGGRVDVDPTTTGSCVLGISLPVASNLAQTYQLNGAAACTTIAGQSAGIYGDSANDRASMSWIAVDVTNQPMFFTFTYLVI